MAKEYAKGFYNSKAWKETRDAYYKYRRGLCERCMEAGQQNPGTIVHHRNHITPQNINDPKVTLSFNNLELLCDDCHNKHHKATPRRVRYDKQGNIIPCK